MREKSDLAATSLRMGAFLCRPHARDDAARTVELDLVAVMQPRRQSRDRNDRRSAHLARNDGGVGEEAAAFDEDPARRRKEHDPARIGTRSDEDLAFSQAGRVW